MRSQNVVEEILQQQSDHRMGRDPRVVGRQAHPQARHSFPRDALPEAVDETCVWQHSVWA